MYAWFPTAAVSFFSHVRRRVMISHCGFSLHFSSDLRFWVSFHVALIIPISPLDYVFWSGILCSYHQVVLNSFTILDSQVFWFLLLFFFLFKNSFKEIEFTCRTVHPFKCTLQWFLVCSQSSAAVTIANVRTLSSSPKETSTPDGACCISSHFPSPRQPRIYLSL